MKKGILIVITVAILGGLGMYINGSSRKGSTGLTSPASGTAIGQTSTTASTDSSSTGTSTSNSSGSATYKDGTFTGTAEDTAYGTVKIAIVVSGGKITDVNFLEMPSDQGHSQEVTAYAEPLLKQTTLQKQSANIDFVSGATSTSYGYQSSLQSALDRAVQS